MKRIHLFEIEDFDWFPSTIRSSMTRLLNVVHELVGTKEDLSELLIQLLQRTGQSHIIDLCSGSGGPMPEVLSEIKRQPGLAETTLALTDLFPDKKASEMVSGVEGITYNLQPVDATSVDASVKGIRTMVGSFHHMPPNHAKQILRSAFIAKQPICIFEISDNSFPVFLWWVPIPINFLMCFFVTLKVRPLTLSQILLTYVLPIIPICYAWDGAVSNARTYTLSDLDELLEGLDASDYRWEMGVTSGKMKKLYLVGAPVN